MACGGEHFITLVCGECGVERRVAVNCGDRTCPDCRARDYKRLKAKYGPMLASLESERLVFITLTRKIRPGRDPQALYERVKETREAFNALIRQKRFKLLQGGFYTFEVKWSKKYYGWNVHIHAVCELVDGATRKIWIDNRGRGRNKGRFKADIFKTVEKNGNGKVLSLTVQSLRKAWKRLTHDSDRVDIAPVLDRFGGTKGVMSYILKYLNKPAEVSGHNDEYNRGLKGHRLVNAFGTWYPTHKKYRFKAVPKPEKHHMVCDVCESTFWIPDFWVDIEIRKYRKEREHGQHGRGAPCKVDIVDIIERPGELVPYVEFERGPGLWPELGYLRQEE